MNPRRLDSETITSMFMDGCPLPRSPPHTSAVSRHDRSSNLAEELRRARRLSHESREVGLEHGLQLTFVTTERRSHRLVPRRRPDALERCDGADRDRDEIRQTARTRVAHQSAVSELRA